MPVTAAAVGIGSAAAGGIVSGIGSLFQGQAQSAMYNYQAGVAQANATIAKQNATYAEQVGGVEAQESGMRTRAQVGATRAAFGSSNVEGGSQNRVLASETEIGQQGEGIVRANAAKRAYGFQVGAAEDTAQTGAYKTSAATSITSGDIGAVTSIIGGAGGVSSKWMQASSSGVFNG